MPKPDSRRSHATGGRVTRSRAVLGFVIAAGLAGLATPIYLRSQPAPPATTEPGSEAMRMEDIVPETGSGPAPAGPASPDAVAPAPARPQAGDALPAWRRLGVPAAAAEGRPTIAIMIDDMGLNRPQTERAVHLPAPLTLSWMPYAPAVTEQAANGAAHGHETMLHMNMEALGRTDPGPDSLRTWLPAETNLAYVRHALDRLPNAVGLNQHEGSVASLSVPLMDIVMGELKARGLLFVDSLTIPHSVALRRAAAAGVPALPRDVFLDNSPDPNAIRAQLAAMEAIARRSGHVIAIGHPRQTTMDVLAAYLPTVAAHGFVLWPVSATVAVSKNLQVAQRPAAE
jgi:hypothetical protein